jgi:ABC-type transporter Mla maintaining outer membrane lipid asymmetry permease subunit MlaE
VVQFVREFAKLGLTRSVGGVLGLALSRELTPVVTAIILAGRVGSAFAAELGTMQVTLTTASNPAAISHLCRWCMYAREY